MVDWDEFTRRLPNTAKVGGGQVGGEQVAPAPAPEPGPAPGATLTAFLPQAGEVPTVAAMPALPVAAPVAELSPAAQESLGAGPRAEAIIPFSLLGSVGLLVAGLIALLAAVSGYEERTFDSYVHMFFASHYRHSWFDTFDPRWYGGISVTTYPPLTHQFVALASLLLGYEKGFVLVTLGAILGMSYGITILARRFPLRSPPNMALWLFTLTPTAHRFAYVYGQLPTLLATTFAIFVAVWLDDWLREGRWRQLLGFVALIGATAGMHHVTLLFEAGMCLLMVILALHRESLNKHLVQRTVLAAVLAAIVVASVVWPFVLFASGAPQAEIPHFTRDPLWTRPFDVALVEQLVFILGSLLLASYAVFERRFSVMWLCLATFVIALFSAGNTTPIPRLVLGSQFFWLTFDKFHLWTAPLFALCLVTTFKISERALLVLCAVMLPVVLVQVSHKAADTLQPPFVSDISGPLSVLNQPGAEKYRHLTLGFGDQLCRFDLYGKSPSVDGDYHTARTDSVLRMSGVATVDASKYYDKGPEILRYLLGAANDKSLRWVLVNDDWYYPFLFENGFDLLEVYPSGISMFEKADVPAITAERHETGVAAMVWGAGPLSLAVLALIAGVIAVAKRPV